jgi:flagellar hook-associated protein 2
LLQDQQNTWTSQSNELTTIDGLLTNLQTAVQGIQQAMDGSSFAASYSTSGIVTASLDDTAQEGVYPIEVQDIGSYASGTTDSDWGTPAAGSTFNLVVGGESYAISSTDTSATGIASAINSQYGNLVQATVLNAGSGTTADTRISLQAVALGTQTLDIQTSSGTSLFGTTGQTVAGSQAEYSVPGTGAASVYTDSRSVTISPGVTLTLQSASPGNEVDTTVSRPDSTLSTAISTFVNAYNAVATEVANQYGPNGQTPGPLEGNTTLQSIAETLSQIGTYGTSGGDVNSLENLGVDLGINGQMTFTALNLASTDIENSSAVDAFLGNSTTSGFLEAATNAMTSLEDPTTGIVKNAESDLQTQIANIGTTISTKQAAVSTMATNLTNQMAQADALLSTTEQQYDYMNELFQAQQTEEQELAL